MQIFAKMRKELLERCTGNRIFLKGKSDASIDTAIFKGSIHKAIIVSLGMGRFYEEMPYSERLITCIRSYLGDITVAFVNNPGIIESTGQQTPSNIGYSVYKLYKHLINEEGFDPEDIICYGHSDGGLHALLGAYKIQELYPLKSISLVSDRSYEDISSVINQFIGGVKGTILSSLFRICGWKAPAVDKFTALKGKKLVIYSTKDPVVGKPCTFLNALKLRGYKDFSSIKLDNSVVKSCPFPFVVFNDAIHAQKTCTHHNRAFSLEEGKKIFQAIHTILFPITH